MIALQSRRGPIVAKETPSRAPARSVGASGGFLQRRKHRRQQAQAGLLLAGVVTAGLICWGFADLFVTKTKIALAEQETAAFEEMAEDAELGSVATAIASLDYVVGYDSSDTKRGDESPLDLIVERSRHAAVARIVAALRKKTGHDYGDDPRAWIRELR